jgi:hypothetical protein
MDFVATFPFEGRSEDGRIIFFTIAVAVCAGVAALGAEVARRARHATRREGSPPEHALNGDALS